MDRVASTMRVVDDVESGRFSADAASKAIAAIAKAPPAPTWLFALAAAAGAVALSVIFGVEHFLPTVLIFVSAGAGAILRRALARISANLFIQPFCAAFLAGVIGAIAVRSQIVTSFCAHKRVGGSRERVMPTQAHARPARRAGCTLYEIDPRSGETIEIFYADTAVAQSFGARGAGFYRRGRGCSSNAPSGPFVVCLDAYRDALLVGKAGR